MAESPDRRGRGPPSPGGQPDPRGPQPDPPPRAYIEVTLRRRGPRPAPLKVIFRGGPYRSGRFIDVNEDLHALVLPAGGAPPPPPVLLRPERRGDPRWHVMDPGVSYCCGNFNVRCLLPGEDPDLLDSQNVPLHEEMGDSSSIDTSGFELDTGPIFEDLKAISINIIKDAPMEELISPMNNVMRKTCAAVRSMPSSSAPVYDFDGGLPNPPSSYIQNSPDEIVNYLIDCSKWIEELEQQVIDTDTVFSSTGSWLEPPAKAFTLFDLFFWIAVMIENIHQYIHSKNADIVLKGLSNFTLDTKTCNAMDLESSSAAPFVTRHMQIPLSYTDAVIGAYDASISDIRRSSGATITVQETSVVPGEMTLILEINGTATQVQTAQQLIQNLVARAGASAMDLESSSAARFTLRRKSKSNRRRTV